MIAATLITGAPANARRDLIDAWRSQKPDGEGWAVLRSASGTGLLPRADGSAANALRRDGLWQPARRVSATGPSVRAGMKPVATSDAEAKTDAEAGAGPAIAATQPAWLETVQACLCCSPQPVLLAALARLLRRRRWSHLLIDLEASGRPAMLIDVLRAQPLVRQLALVEVVAVLDVPLAAQALDAGRQGWLAEQVASADRLILRLAPPAPEQMAGSEPPIAIAWRLAAQLQRLADFELPVQIWDLGSSVQSPPLGSCAAQPVPPPGTVSDCGEPAAEAARGAVWRWRDGPGQVFDRRALAAVLEAARLEQAFDEVRAVFRTERDWYQYRAGAADPWEPTLHRSASRIELVGLREAGDEGGRGAESPDARRAGARDPALPDRRLLKAARTDTISVQREAATSIRICASRLTGGSRDADDLQQSQLLRVHPGQ